MRFETNIPQKEYDRFVQEQPYNHLLQSYNWAKIKNNWDSMTLGLYDDNDQLTATSLVLSKTLPFGFKTWYIPRGPILDWENPNQVKTFFDHLKKLAKKNNVIFIKFDPAYPIQSFKTKDRPEGISEKGKKVVSLLESIGAEHKGYTLMLEDTVQPRFESVAFFEPDTKNVESTMPRHTKKLIKVSNKHGVSIEEGHEELLDTFANLVQFTEARKGISLRDKEYFKRLLEIYGNDAIIHIAYCNLEELMQETKTDLASVLHDLETCPENAKKKRNSLLERQVSLENKLKSCEQMIQDGLPKEKTPIAGMLSVKYGPYMEMLYAGMDERFKQFMAQYKNYVEIFQWGLEHGCKKVSMGGIEGDLNDGLTQFKDNFDPMIEEYAGEFDLPIKKIVYSLVMPIYRKKTNKK